MFRTRTNHGRNSRVGQHSAGPNALGRRCWAAVLGESLVGPQCRSRRLTRDVSRRRTGQLSAPVWPGTILPSHWGRRSPRSEPTRSRAGFYGSPGSRASTPSLLLGRDTPHDRGKKKGVGGGGSEVAWQLAVDIEIRPSHDAASLGLSGVHGGHRSAIPIGILVVQGTQHVKLCPLEILPANLTHCCCD